MWLGQLFLLSNWLFRVLQTGVGTGSKLGLKLLNPTSCVHKLQLASVKRMTNIANVHSELLPNTACYETVPASAGDLSFDVFWVNAIFHDFAALRLGANGLDEKLVKLGMDEKGEPRNYTFLGKFASPFRVIPKVTPFRHKKSWERILISARIY